MPIVYTRKRLRAQQPIPPCKPSRSTPPPEPPQPPPPLPRKKKRYTQLHIDAGQSDLITTCSTCMMLYTPGKDDATHKSYHATHTHPRWSPATRSRRVATHAGLSIHVITPSHCTRAARRIDAFVTRVLGTPLAFPEDAWLTVVAVAQGFVRGFCLVERIRGGWLVREGGLNMAEGMRDAVLGVRKIWVDPLVRGRGVATRLVEEACLALVYGLVVERRFVAFTAMTQDGAKFADKFCGGRVLVYHVNNNNGVLMRERDLREDERAVALPKDDT